MKDGAKKTSSKTDQRRERRKYAWYRRGPFQQIFDASHWWASETEVQPAAALYELARRHPLVRKHWLRTIAAIKKERRALGIRSGHPVHSRRPQTAVDRMRTDPYWFSSVKHDLPSWLWSTCQIGLMSWEGLDYTSRENWKHSVGNLKGLDWRSDESKCRKVNDFAFDRLFNRRQNELKSKGLHDKKVGHREWARLVRESMKSDPFSLRDWEMAIAEAAIVCFRAGDILFAVAADLKANDAARLLGREYRKRSAIFFKPLPIPRAKWESWLPLIEEFERVVVGGDKDFKKAFAHYRRALDGIQFSKSNLSVPVSGAT